MPFLFVDQEGNRFMDETCCRMGYMNNFARPYLAKAGFADSTACLLYTSAILESGRFAATVLAEDAPMELIGTFGFHTSADTDKFAALTLIHIS